MQTDLKRRQDAQKRHRKNFREEQKIASKE